MEETKIAISEGVSSISTTNSHNYFRNCGYIYIYIYLKSCIIWSKTFIATQSFMLPAEQSSGNCQLPDDCSAGSMKL